MNDAVVARKDYAGLRQGHIGILRWRKPVGQPSGPAEVAEGLVVVLSHDCDLPNPEEESVEFGRALKIGACDGNLTYGKNPRKLHLENAGTPSYAVALEMRGRLEVRWDDLESFTLVAPLDARNVEILQRWLSNRYSRSAFPDAFNLRRSPAKAAVRKALAKGVGGKSLSGVYVAVTEEELDEGQDYGMVIVGAMPVEFFADADLRAAAEAAIADIASHLNRLDGLAVDEFMVLSEGEITLDDLLRLRRLDFDDLSMRPVPIGRLPGSI